MRRNYDESSSLAKHYYRPSYKTMNTIGTDYAGSGTTVTLNKGTEEEIQLHAYKYSQIRRILSWLLIIITLGFAGLIFYWKPEWWLKLTAKPTSMAKADTLIVRDQHHEISVRPIMIKGARDGIPGKVGNGSLASESANGTMDLPGGSPKQIQYFNSAGELCRAAGFRYFTYRKLKYLWNDVTGMFEQLRCLDDGIRCAYYHESGPVSDADVAQRHASYGPNLIIVRLKSIPELLFREVLNPFYVFQIFSLILWSVDDYWKYALCIAIVSLLSVCTDVYQIDRNQKDLRKMIHYTGVVSVLRDKEEEGRTIDSSDLVPGDIIVIPSGGCVMQCDAVLLEGNCIVNESMLTGESVPVTKTPIPGSETNLVYSTKEHGRHTLFSGTQVLQTRFYGGKLVRATVIRTGFYTAKGGLVRSIMYPKPVDFQFTKDLFKMLGILSVIALAGFIYALVIMIERGAIIKEVILRSLDIVTIVVPPALPFAMTVGIMLARSRLKKQKIFCISPSTINTCGGINVVVFDKTGTLTEDGLDFQCAMGLLDPELGQRPLFDTEISTVPIGRNNSPCVQAMAVCNSLTYINGELSGDPLDLILFRATGWDLIEPASDESSHYDQIFPTVVRCEQPPGNPIELGILKQFTFSSSLQRMSVIVKGLTALGEGSDFMVFSKGSPEKIASLCRTGSIPSDFATVLEAYTQKGYRVIGLANKVVKLPYHKAVKLPREQVESELEFLGLVVLENRLKPETTPVIKRLNRANIRIVMATGDNIQTAMSVARECGILAPNIDTYSIEWKRPLEPGMEHISGTFSISPVVDGAVDGSDSSNEVLDSIYQSAMDWRDVAVLVNDDAERGNTSPIKPPYQFALTGDAYNALSMHHPSVIPNLVATATVFARMSPDHKAKLVGHLQELDYVVGMCGDGANDCGALKVAHAGISLSDAEASIASPFTSKTPNISCVPTVIREGRAALVTSFGTFKYMANYSLCQFFSVSLLYWLATNLSDYQFLYIDLFLLTLLAAVFGYTDAASQLSPQPPHSRVLSPSTISSIGLQMLLTCAFQLFIFLIIPLQPWFVPFYPPPEVDNYYSYQVTGVFLVSTFQYVTLALVHSKAGPHRKTVFNNKLLLAVLAFTTGVSIWITIWPPGFLSSLLNLMTAPDVKFRVFILLLVALNTVISLLVEWYIVDYLLVNVLTRKQMCGLKPESAGKKYEVLLSKLGPNPEWMFNICADRR